jgi:hypothetical protein
MILNDVWLAFNSNIQSESNRDFTDKMRAINFGNNYLANRIIQLCDYTNYPGELLSDPTNLANDATSNKFSLPSDYLDLYHTWYKLSSRYYSIQEQRVEYQQFIEAVNDDFFDSTYTGTPEYFAVKEPYLYVDKYYTASGTDNIKIQYMKVPATIYGYSQINVDSVPASFAVGETVTGSSTSAIGIIYSKGTGYIRCLINDVSGEFTSSDTLTCTNSVDTCTVTSFVSASETTMLGMKYQLMLIEAWALQWHVFKGSDEIEARSNTLDDMIREMAKTNLIIPKQWGY